MEPTYRARFLGGNGRGQQKASNISSLCSPQTAASTQVSVLERPAAVEIQGGVNVRISVQRKVAFGQVVKLTGSGTALGDWNAANGAQLAWGDGDNWTTTLSLPPGKHEFKVSKHAVPLGLSPRTF